MYYHLAQVQAGRRDLQGARAQGLTAAGLATAASEQEALALLLQKISLETRLQESAMGVAL